MLDTYTTLEGRVLDLTGLNAEQRAFFARAVTAYRAGTGWDDFCQMTSDPSNALLRPTDGWVTRAVYEHPLFQAVQDLEGRIAIREGAPVNPRYDPSRDPLADEWLSPIEAAARKGTRPASIHRAIARGALVARPTQPGSQRRLVSANSLARWTPRTGQRRGHAATPLARRRAPTANTTASA